jgi:hypothetical protein
MIITSTVLPILLLLPLYPLIRNIYFPPTPLEILEAEEAAQNQFQEVADLVEQAGHSDNPAEEGEKKEEREMGMGLKIDLGRARRELGIGMMVDELKGLGDDLNAEVNEMGEGEMEGEGSGKKGKKGKGKGKEKEKRKLGVWRKQLEDEYGAGAVFVLGDLAVSHRPPRPACRTFSRMPS